MASDRAALDDMLPSIYAELKRLARAYLGRERADHTLQPTALVHEAFLRLVGQERAVWKGRGHFVAVAAQAMRRITCAATAKKCMRPFHSTLR